MKHFLASLLAIIFLVNVPAGAQDTLIYLTGQRYEVFIVRETKKTVFFKREQAQEETEEIPTRLLRAIYYENGRRQVFSSREAPHLRSSKREIARFRSWVEPLPGDPYSPQTAYLLQRVGEEQVYLIPAHLRGEADPTLVPVAFEKINTLTLRRRGSEWVVAGSGVVGTATGFGVGAFLGLMVDFARAENELSNDSNEFAGTIIGGILGTIGGAWAGIKLGNALAPKIVIPINRTNPEKQLLAELRRYTRE